MTETAKVSLVYFLKNTMYINVTNLCTNRCVFCIRSLNDKVIDANLWLKDENVKAEDVIAEIKLNSPEKVDEIVFCGYGEPLIKLDVVKATAEFIKENYPNIPTRVNTNGHANLIHKRDITPELVGLIDRVSVSLNAETADLYDELACSNFEKELAFESVKEFIGKCQKAGIDTTATVVSGFKHYVVDIDKCRAITEELGAKFKVREWLEEGYN